MIHFDCDYMNGAHPEVMKALIDSNLDQTPGYGADPYCERAKDLIRKACGADDADVFFMVGGTQTNATVIDGLLARHEGVLCAETAHINAHEAGAIEASGHKVIALPHKNGKVSAEVVKKYISDYYSDDTYEHIVAPGMLYITHATEYGTVYTLQELKDLSEVCHEYDIPLYLDGARLGYGLAAEGTDVTMKDIANLCDVFYIGGTKEGALMGEAVVARKGLLKHFFSLMKQHGAVLAKGRLLGVQFGALFTDDLYMRISRHAVSMAMILRKGLISKGYELFMDSPTNQQFFKIPNAELDRIAKVASFEYWGPRGVTDSVVRFVTGWATTPEEIDILLQA